MLQLFRRICTLIRWQRLENNLAEELDSHRVLKQQELERSGLDSTDASVAARCALGNVTQAKEDARAVWLWPWLESTWQDASHMSRNVHRQPGFMSVAGLTLALGIGANTAIFSVIDTLLLRPPAIAQDFLSELRLSEVRHI